MTHQEKTPALNKINERKNGKIFHGAFYDSIIDD